MQIRVDQKQIDFNPVTSVIIKFLFCTNWYETYWNMIYNKEFWFDFNFHVIKNVKFHEKCITIAYL